MRPLIRSGGKTIQGPQAVTEAPLDGKQYVRKDGEWSETDFTQVEKTKLAGIAVEATKNRADSLNADKEHTHPWSQVTGQPETATRWPTFTEVTDNPLTEDEITKLKALLATVTVSDTAVTFSGTVDAEDVYIRG